MAPFAKRKLGKNGIGLFLLWTLAAPAAGLTAPIGSPSAYDPECLRQIFTGGAAESVAHPRAGETEDAAAQRFFDDAVLDLDSVRTVFPDNGREFDARIKLIADPAEGLLTKVMMIRNARHTIDLATYILTPDLVGKTILKELKDAVLRGVNVRLIVDALGTPAPTMDRKEIRSLLHVEGGFVKDAAGNDTNVRARAETVVFNPMIHLRSSVAAWYLKLRNMVVSPDKRIAAPAIWRNRRMHDKILQTDAAYADLALAIIGGRNIAEAYYGIPHRDAHTYTDMEILIRNATPDQDVTLDSTLGRHFNQLYYHLGNKFLGRFSMSVAGFTPAKQLAKLDAAHAQLFAESPETAQKLAQMIQGDFLNQGFELARVKLLHEVENILRRNAFLNPKDVYDYFQDSNVASIVEHFRQEMATAKESIDVVSPYVVFTDEEIQEFKVWLKADPKRRLRILTNSVATGDNMLAQSVIDGELAPKLLADPDFPEAATQIEFYSYGKMDGTQYGGSEFYGKIHAKFVIIDGVRSMVMSSNLDWRSRNLNSEVGLAIRSAVVGPDEAIENPDPTAPPSETPMPVDIPTATRLLVDKFRELTAKSYRWGSAEWKAVRAHKTNDLKDEGRSDHAEGDPRPGGSSRSSEG